KEQESQTDEEQDLREAHQPGRAASGHTRRGAVVVLWVVVLTRRGRPGRRPRRRAGADRLDGYLLHAARDGQDVAAAGALGFSAGELVLDGEVFSTGAGYLNRHRNNLVFLGEKPAPASSQVRSVTRPVRAKKMATGKGLGAVFHESALLFRDTTGAKVCHE